MALNGKRMFPCPVCTEPREVRETKKAKPYLVCDPCGVQVFVRGEVAKAFQMGASPYDRGFMPSLAGLVIKVLNEPKFPKRKEARINFLADSLAGVGCVTPRRSRDICEQERAKAKRAHHIVCYEFYVECSCGHKGRSRNHACPKCGARIFFGFGSIFNSARA